MLVSNTKGKLNKGLNDANITPLADVTTTLIVVFLITMPAIMWNGIQVNQAEAGTENAEIQPTEIHDDDLITVAVDPEGIRLNGRLVTAEELEAELPERLAAPDWRNPDFKKFVRTHPQEEKGRSAM